MAMFLALTSVKSWATRMAAGAHRIDPNRETQSQNSVMHMDELSFGPLLYSHQSFSSVTLLMLIILGGIFNILHKSRLLNRIASPPWNNALVSGARPAKPVIRGVQMH